MDRELFPALRDIAVDSNTSFRRSVIRSAFDNTNNYMKDGVLLRQVVNVIDGIDFADYETKKSLGAIYEEFLRELQSAGSAGEFYTPRAVTSFMSKMIAPKLGEKMADYACGTGGFLTGWLDHLPAPSTPEEVALRECSVFGIEKKQFPQILCAVNLLLHGADPRVVHGNSLTGKKVLDLTDDDRVDVILMNPPYGSSELEGVKKNFPADLASSETFDLFMILIMYRLKRTGRAAVILPDGFLTGGGNKSNIKKKLLGGFDLHTVIRLPKSVFAPYTSINTNILFFNGSGPTKSTWFYRLDMPEGYKNFSKTRPMREEHFAPAERWWNDRQPISVDGFDKAREFSPKELEERGYDLDLCGFPHEAEEVLSPRELMRDYRDKRSELGLRIDEVLSRLERELGEERV